jgi:hypothetical protein
MAAQLMSSSMAATATALLLLTALVCMAAAAPVVLSSGPIVVLNPNFETPNTFHFERVIESWTSTSQAGLYRVPVTAYPGGLLVSVCGLVSHGLREGLTDRNQK